MDPDRDRGLGARQTLDSKPPRFSLELLTVKEVAQLLKLKPKTVYLWAASGKLPCLRLEGVVRFERDALLRWLDARKE